MSPSNLLGHTRRFWGQRRRQAGRYERMTLAIFFAAWRAAPQMAQLLAWAHFRRDLGMPLTGRFARAMHADLAKVRPRSRSQALGLLAELDPAQVRVLPAPWKAGVVQRLPALGSLLGLTEPDRPVLAVGHIANMQGVWREAFAEAVRAALLRAAPGVCGIAVIGNAAALRGSGLGRRLDACAMVLRFNEFANAVGDVPDVGKRLHVWVVSPGYRGPAPAQVDWVLLTGPAVEFRLSDWSAVLALAGQGVPVLTVPLPVWRHCVHTLQAPPSSGVLVLWWLHNLCGGSWAGIGAAGIGLGLNKTRHYHLARAGYRPSKRHDWEAEAALMQSWHAAGLHRFGGRLLCVSRGVARIPTLTALLADGHGVLAWGRKPSASRAKALADDLHLPLLQLEDGFLRSFGTGDQNPPLSLVVDDQGIYYDSTQPSALESLLAGDSDVLAGIAGDVAQAKGLLLKHGLSKYNHAPDWVQAGSGSEPVGATRVLVVDQTAGDMSVAFGGANAEAFVAMLAAAQAENPLATIYVKTHPEVTSGRKGGYFTAVRDTEANGQRTVVLREAINPLSLIKQMDRVYVVTSTMGFEALLAGKPVTCFGVPWYAGWGATDNRCVDSPAWARRTRQRSVDELFAAAYFHYSRYLNPLTHERGTIFDVIDWLVRQRESAARMHGVGLSGHVLCVGFPRWRAANLKPMLGMHAQQVMFAPTVQAAEPLAPKPGDTLVCWGATPPAGLAAMAKGRSARLLHIEDGFIRSVGLGSDLIRPLSLVLDERGIYFDATRPSDLEVMLNTRSFTPDDLARAQAVRAFIVQHAITKYNLEPRGALTWASQGRSALLVPGQVEDDASIRLGCTKVNTNLGLLQAVRAAHPDAFIVYKPHPDVLSRNRKGRVSLEAARQFADHIEVGLSVVSCIEAADEVHTMTSLTGFDALLRGKKVVTYGQPFYAGWGLTEDRTVNPTAFARRQRHLTLDELVAGALLHYPIYWDWDLKGYTSCEAVLHRIVAQRTALEASGGLHKLHSGWLRRQFRKLAVLWRAWTPGFQ